MIAARRRTLAAALSALLLAAVGGGSLLAATAPAAPAPAAPAPAASPEELQRLAREVYVYAYPLVVMDVASEIATAKTPINSFQHRRTLPDPSSTETPYPTVDTLSSAAWLDLSAGPVILSVPDTKGRYYQMPMLGGWTDVFQSPGKRTTTTEKREFAIVGPKWRGEIPKLAEEIRAPTDLVWINARIQVNGKGDVAAVNKLQDQFKLAPMSKSKKPTAAPSANVDPKTPPVEQVAKMDAKTYFTRVAMLLPTNPPGKEDAAMIDRAKKLGIVPGQRFDTSKLDAARASAIEEGAKSALGAIRASAAGATGEIRNGWTLNWDLGRYGTNYGLRAVVAYSALGANAPEDALFARTRLDGGGRALSGANKYVLHFDKGKQPPTEAFWSVTMYNDKGFLVANPIERYSIGDREKPRLNADGSLDIYLQQESPGKDKESNWLPAPKDNFNVMLRVFWPKADFVERRWTPPPIQKLAG
jgi:hypothetical protein